eukprot:Seg7760.2 transcript_id=Seg7760.2/GoldUCD/mRNA.D3Y31 product="hypothetical protein" protein_id=Seg7760.2/GoldUCD/D3Y31
MRHSKHRIHLLDIVNALEEVCSGSDCILFKAIPREENNIQMESPKQFVNSLEDCRALSTSVDEVMHFADKLNENEKDKIEKLTKGQAENGQWYRFRKHVITASKAHDVKTRMETAQRKGMEKTDFQAVCEKVSGCSKLNPNIPALKFGRAMEGEAISIFIEHYAKTHKDAKVTECGLFLNKELTFAGGSQDGILSCDCCGEFCLEIKRPISISHTFPWDPNVSLPFLKREDDLLVMKENHKYYTQCQMQ